jgi:hypothetical protein
MSEGTRAPYIYMVQMDIPAAHEADFNRIYDTEHVPEILKVAGVRGCTRYMLEKTNKEGMARYLALYEMDAANVMESPAWLRASEIGDWAPKIRPHTTNRSHKVMRKIA